MAAALDYQGERLDAGSFLELVGLSAHILVTPIGNRIRCRRDDQGSYHAKGHNTDSLGIEVLVPGVYNLAELQRITAQTGWVSREQFDAIVEQISEWKQRHGIKRIDRHSDLDPERKWFDPGDGFPWAELLQRTWGSS